MWSLLLRESSGGLVVSPDEELDRSISLLPKRGEDPLFLLASELLISLQR